MSHGASQRRQRNSRSTCLPVLAIFLGAAAVCAATMATSSSMAFAWLTGGHISGSRQVLPRPSGHFSRWTSRLPMLAEDSEAAPAETPAEAPEASKQEPAVIAPLFQELNVSNATDSRKLMGAIVGVFNKGDRACDLVLTDPRAKATMMYAVATLPDAFNGAAQILLRRRDRRLRMRVLQHFRPVPDEDAEVLRVSKTTNTTKLGSAIMSKFVDVVGNNLRRTIKLQFAGKDAAQVVVNGIEKAAHKAHRELTFSPRMVKVPADPAQPEGNQQVSFDVTVVAT